MGDTDRELRRLQAWFAGASNGDIARLARELFPGEDARAAHLRAATLRLYALRMEPTEWSDLLLHGRPALIAVDSHDAALLHELVLRCGARVEAGLRFRFDAPAM